VKYLTLLAGLFYAFNTSAKSLNDYTYYFHPTSTLTLGKGLDPAQPNEEKRICFDFPEPNKKTEGALKTTASIEVLENTRNITAILNYDTNIDANLLFFSANTQFDFDNTYTLDKRSVSVVVKASTEYGRLFLKKPVLLPEYAEMLDKKQFNQFRTFCGSRLVTTEVRGATVAVVITIENASSELISKLKITGSGGKSVAGIGAKAKAMFEAEYRDKSTNNEVRAQLFAVGGNGISDLDKVVQNMVRRGERLDEIADGLQKFISGFTVDNSAPVRFYTTHIDPRLDDRYSDLIGEKKTKALLDIVWAYRNAELMNGVVTKFLNNINDERRLNFKKENLISASEELPLLTDHIEELQNRHAECLLANNSDVKKRCKMPSAPDLFWTEVIYDIIGE